MKCLLDLAHRRSGKTVQGLVVADLRAGLTVGAEERCLNPGRELEGFEQEAVLIYRNSSRIEAVYSGIPAAKPNGNFVPADFDLRYREVGHRFWADLCVMKPPLGANGKKEELVRVLASLISLCTVFADTDRFGLSAVAGTVYWTLRTRSWGILCVAKRKVRMPMRSCCAGARRNTLSLV